MVVSGGPPTQPTRAIKLPARLTIKLPERVKMRLPEAHDKAHDEAQTLTIKLSEDHDKAAKDSR